MEWVETAGKSVEAAKNAALEQLGVDESDAEFEVVEEGRGGLFGIGRVDARIRARIKPATPRSKDQGKRRNRRDRPRSNDRSNDNKKPQKSNQDNGRQDASNDPGKHFTGVQGSENTDKVDSPAGRSDSLKNQRNKNRRNKPVSTEGDSKMENVALEDQVVVLVEFLEGLFAETSTKVDISTNVDNDEEQINVLIDGENLGHLIGAKGSSLHALQEVTRTVVQRKTGARNGRILLDVCHYREKRKAALGAFAKQLAEEVRDQKVEKTLEPMHPADRKIVHDTINDIDGVETISAGEEPRRYVVIRPAN